MSKKKNKNKEIVKASGLDGLAQFRKDLSPQVERPPVAPARVEAEIPPRRRFSANINNQHRAGRAPYNFVPLPEKARAFASPPPHDRFDPYLHSGVIEFDFRAERDFYIRGGWNLDVFRREKKKIKEQEEPFKIGDKLVLPGSSLRGMLRTLVEIASAAPLDPINNQQLFYRAVGASTEAGDSSYEPQAEVYKRRLGEWDRTKAEVGILRKTASGWTITPLKTQTKYRIDSRLAGNTLGHHQIKFEVPPPGNLVTKFEKRGHTATVLTNAVAGWLICSGSVPGKHKQWIVCDDRDDVKTFPIPREDWQAYLDGGISQWLKTKGRCFHPETIGSEGVPVFFVKWQDSSGKGERVAFGHTPFFRLPYETTIQGANPLGAATDPVDMATAIFGGLNTKKSRIAVQDALLIKNLNPPLARKTVAALGAPKPTTYQHYLVQTDRTGDVRNAIHWDSAQQFPNDSNKRPTLRGHKLYWHHQKTYWEQTISYNLPQPAADATSTFNRVSVNPDRHDLKPVFRVRIRYDNLRDAELGALLFVVDLPKQCAHKLGMGKPLGMGSFRALNLQVRRIDRCQRYESLFDSDGAISTCESAMEQPQIQFFKDQFACWYLNTQSVTSHELWLDQRMLELKALLNIDVTPDIPNWDDRTRYMGFSVAGVTPQNYNEYLVPTRRKSLPPASQVADKEAKLPDDSSPFRGIDGSSDEQRRSQGRRDRR